LPRYVGLGIAWCLGLLLDVLYGTLLGTHAFAMVITLYFLQKVYLQVRMFPIWQQSFCIAVLVLMYQSILLLVHAVTGRFYVDQLAWLFPALSSMLLWPFVVIILSSTRRRLRVGDNFR